MATDPTGPRLPLTANARLAADALPPDAKAALAPVRVPAGRLDAAVAEVLRAQGEAAEGLPADAKKVELDEASVRRIEDLTGDEAARAAAGLAGLAAVAKSFPAAGPAEAAVEDGLRALAARVKIPGLAEAAAAEAPAPEPPAPAPAPAADDADLGSRPVARRCPRCSWDSSRLDVVEATTDDRLRWAASLYGGRFAKRYELLGGALAITFRALTTRELDAAYARAARDAREDPALFIPRAAEYQFYLCLDVVELPLQPRRLPVPHADCVGPGGAIDFDRLKAAVTTDVIPGDSLSRIANAKYQAFRALVDWMEAAVDSPDFLEGIGATI